MNNQRTNQERERHWSINLSTVREKDNDHSNEKTKSNQSKIEKDIDQSNDKLGDRKKMINHMINLGRAKHWLIKRSIKWKTMINQMNNQTIN